MCIYTFNIFLINGDTTYFLKEQLVYAQNYLQINPMI